MHSRSFAVALLAGCLAIAAPNPSAAQSPTSGANRDRGFTVTAVRIPAPLAIDGMLDEDVYARVQPADAFIQQEPNEGQAATEKTEVWVFFDDTRLYVAARCWDSQPERIKSSERRRDVVTISQNDNLVVTLDTFNDRRTGYYFQTTPGGAIRDQVVTDDRPNSDWNTVWDTRSARFDHGYAIEMAIPFKSLRYAGSGPQTWGVNFRRFVAWKNEMQFLTPMPAAYAQSAITRFSDSATLVGLETPARAINMEVTPYAAASVTTDRAAATPFHNHGRGSAGVDLKYGLTRGLEADVTVNTDFAQVEEDVQQVNLTRFSLFLPEKRNFFLESQGLFTFADPGITGPTLAPGDVPLLFFSRRIGLNDGQSIPVVAGGRIWGKAGPASIGLLHIRTGDKPEANARTTDFSVARVKWDVLGRSSVGLMATRRATSLTHDTNTALGADATLLLLPERRRPRLLRADLVAGTVHPQYQLPRLGALGRRSLRPVTRAHQGGSQLRRRRGLRATHRLRPDLADGALQPAPGAQPRHPQVRLSRQPRVHDRRRPHDAAESAAEGEHGD